MYKRQDGKGLLPVILTLDFPFLQSAKHQDLDVVMALVVNHGKHLPVTCIPGLKIDRCVRAFGVQPEGRVPVNDQGHSRARDIDPVEDDVFTAENNGVGDGLEAPFDG